MTHNALLPRWFDLAGAGLFVIVALSHLRHAARTQGQRRPWHICHVLLALGMFCMLAPGLPDRSALAQTWEVLLAGGCVVAAVWTLSGGRSPHPLWFMTSLDFAVMGWMWSTGPTRSWIAWFVILYLAASAVLWGSDLARQLESRRLALVELLPAGGLDRDLSLRGWFMADRSPSTRLIDGLDIGPSMMFMSAAMAYMVLAMRIG